MSDDLRETLVRSQAMPQGTPVFNFQGLRGTVLKGEHNGVEQQLLKALSK